MGKNVIEVFLVDDHPIVEAGLRLGLGLEHDFRLIGSARTHDSALNALEDLAPDVLVTDLVIDGEVDFSYFAHYRELLPDARIVAFSSLSVVAYGQACRDAGADGFISKSTSPHELAEALRALLSQDRGAAPEPRGPALTSVIVLEGIKLTRRESQIARALAEGQSIQSIAEALGISKKTAAIHRDNLRGKLDCPTSAELISLLARVVRPGGP